MSGKQHWRVAAATAAGASHLRDDTPNQDAVAHRVVEIGHGAAAVIAVADGAGSAPRSDEGSRVAVDAAVASVAEGINRRPAAAFSEVMAASLVRYAIERAKIEVERYGRRHNAPARELASTLIVAFASDSLMTAAQVGDGAVIAFNIGGGDAMTLCQAHTGEYANETTFITSRSRPHEIASVGHASGHDYDALALITDGLQNLALKMPEREAFPGFWNPILHDLAHTDEPEAVPARLHAFISGERVQSRTGDDVTIAIAARNPQKAEEGRQ
ncbi:MAG: PP2C family serine/threonine-protein phosphatase [Chloroflexota bacterium]|nr:PP2C family serine/threonine-protein phosphatase [Chloroflexota bacterium]MDE2960895.1 PP2C family serine/threonine-protein phosphatase [Chloroflexota bacterium]